MQSIRNSPYIIHSADYIFLLLHWDQRGYSKKSENYYRLRKVQVGKDQEKARSEKDSQSKNRGGKKTQTNNQVLIP